MTAINLSMERMKEVIDYLKENKPEWGKEESLNAIEDCLDSNEIVTTKNKPETNKILVCKRFEISYSHQLDNHPGKCRNLHGHGGVIEIEFESEVDEETGMVIDFGTIKEDFVEPVKEKLDHKHINDVILYVQPTAENMVKWVAGFIKRKLHQDFEGLELTRVRLWETGDSYAEWKNK